MSKERSDNLVLFLSGRESNYPRNQMIIAALQNSYHTEVISSQRDDISRGSFYCIILQSIKCSIKALKGLIFSKYKFIFVGFFGQFILLFISSFTKVPMVFDFFVSAYDTLVFDRKLFKSNSIIAKLLYKLDFFCCNKAELILVDTKTQGNYFSDIFFIPKEKIKVLFVGCDEDLFHPIEINEDPDLVLYYSTYMPLHGVEIVIQAAKILENTSSIKFKLIGEGMGLQSALELANNLNTSNILFSPSIPLMLLPDEIAKATICLGGHFGNTAKAKRVIPGKIYQILAMRKAAIVGDTKANRELLTHGIDAWFCNLSDPNSLADGIKILHENQELRKQISEAGYQTFKSKASFKTLGITFESTIINQLFPRDNIQRK
ncbi:MAG: glycosyltransferase [Syntrophomonadaceae bacterium]|jgi:glycosyltransferase involved in cell wall biosynthesis|nr:glycosyltransferase [Brevefilum fermentans]HQA28496.1 glycosyltransferase [Brevefilum fermentans]